MEMISIDGNAEHIKRETLIYNLQFHKIFQFPLVKKYNLKNYMFILIITNFVAVGNLIFHQGRLFSPQNIIAFGIIYAAISR